MKQILILSILILGLPVIAYYPYSSVSNQIQVITKANNPLYVHVRNSEHKVHQEFNKCIMNLGGVACLDKAKKTVINEEEKKN